MRATIAYYDPPRRPAPEVRPDFTRLPLAGRTVTVSSMRAAGGGFSLDREGFTLAHAPTCRSRCATSARSRRRTSSTARSPCSRPSATC